MDIFESYQSGLRIIGESLQGSGLAKTLFMSIGLPEAILLAGGGIFLAFGLAFNLYAAGTSKGVFIRGGEEGNFSRLFPVFRRTASLFSAIPFLKPLKQDLYKSISIGYMEDGKADDAVGLAMALILLAGAINLFLLKDIGQLWYVKGLLVFLCFFVPYYIITLAFDLHKNNINGQIPHFIDEFRGCFIKHRKIRPALKESCKYINRSLAKILLKAADSPEPEESLLRLRDSLGNLWFNIFVSIIVNYKSNGGEIIDQLYKLNKTMTRSNNVEKKKNKRLIWYEVFAVAAALVSIPAVFYINSAILGGNTGVIIDGKSNIIISRIIAYSMLSLIIVRILRRM